MASAALAPAFQRLTGIRALADSTRFKVWFLHQFGVLQDGKKPYPGAIKLYLVVAMEKLAEKGAKMGIISNLSRRSSVTMENLESLGFDPSCFLGAIASGESTHHYLQNRSTLQTSFKLPHALQTQVSRRRLQMKKKPYKDGELVVIWETVKIKSTN
uniref:Uncharacterized protein n=1 Tax=Oryza meridionalis TaxID=40149 RepID=A0A0E0ENJ2_9ORYZ